MNKLSNDDKNNDDYKYAAVWDMLASWWIIYWPESPTRLDSAFLLSCSCVPWWKQDNLRGHENLYHCVSLDLKTHVFSHFDGFSFNKCQAKNFLRSISKSRSHKLYIKNSWPALLMLFRNARAVAVAVAMFVSCQEVTNWVTLPYIQFNGK
jgi:hypothetical protein